MNRLIFENLVGAVTCAVGFTGIWLSGNNRRIGWFVALCSEALWVFYAVILRQWALIPACIAWAVVYFRNWRKWRHPTAVLDGRRSP